MDTAWVIVFMGVLVFGALLFNALFDRTKIPNVLLLIVIGIVIGPVLGFVKATDFGRVGPIFSAVTLIIILFESGITLRLKQLIKSIGSSFMVAIFNFLAGAVIATALSYYLTSLDLLSAVFFGVIVAGTSSAVVIPIVKQLKMNEKGGTILVLESALSDVLCLVIGLALLAAMRKGVVEVKEISSTILSSFGVALLIGIACGIFWSLLINKLRAVQKFMFTTVAFVFVVYGVSELLGYNGGIAVLAFGIVMGNAYLLNKTFMRHVIPSMDIMENERSLFAELTFIVQTYFFVYVGVCIQFGQAWVYLLGLLIVGGVIATRPLSIKLFVRGKQMSLKDLSIMSIMSPKGLVPAILASLPLQLGLAGGEIIQNMAFSVVLISIVVCSILVIVVSRDAGGVGPLRKLLFLKSTDSLEEDDEQEDLERSDPLP